MASVYGTQLHCGHTVELVPPPQPLDEVYCRQCQRYTTVSFVFREWAYRCMNRDCHIMRRFGDSETGARTGFTRHALKHPTHTVRLLHGAKIVETITGTSETTLFDLSAHQSGLRDLVERHSGNQAA